MQNTENSKEVQGTEIAQEQLSVIYTNATKNLFSSIGLDDIKQCFQSLLTAWIKSEFIFNVQPEERGEIYFFYAELTNHLEKIHEEFEALEKLPFKTKNTSSDKNIPFELYQELSNRLENFKKSKTCFYTVFKEYLKTEDADCLKSRNAITWYHEEVYLYLKAIHFQDDELNRCG